MPGRREPLQERSQALVDSVVVGALHLLRTTPPGDITTAMLAEAAGCSAAAMFRFFEDKESIFVAAAERLQVVLRARYDVTLAKLQVDADINMVVRALLGQTASFIRREPAFRALRWANLTHPAELQRAYKETNRRLAVQLHQRFAPKSPGVAHAFHSAVEAAGHLVGDAFEHNPRGDRQTLRDAGTMVVMFLNSVL